MAASLDQYDDTTRSEIVQWFHEPAWRLRAIPTPVAFGLGLLFGVATALLTLRALDD